MKPNTAVLALVLFALTLLTASPILTTTAATITCSDVYTDLMPCLGYVQGGPMSRSCCSGIRDLMAAASTKPDRQTVCRCIESVASTGSAYVGRAMGIPKQCKINLPYSLNPNTDCGKIN